MFDVKWLVVGAGVLGDLFVLRQGIEQEVSQLFIKIGYSFYKVLK